MKIDVNEKSLALVSVMTLKSIYNDILEFSSSLKNGRKIMDACKLRRDAIYSYRTPYYYYLRDIAVRFDENCDFFLKREEEKVDEIIKVDEDTLMREALPKLFSK